MAGGQPFTFRWCKIGLREADDALELERKLEAAQCEKRQLFGLRRRDFSVFGGKITFADSPCARPLIAEDPARGLRLERRAV